MKARLVESHRERIARIEREEIKVIGQNCFTETEDSPLTAGADGGILTPDPEVERERREALEEWKAERDSGEVERALAQLAEAAADESRNIMPATIEAAKAGATTGEWAQTLRDVFGDYRAPDRRVGRRGAAATRSCSTSIRASVNELAERIGHRPRILVGKPGLDGHSNGAEQIAVRARDVGMEVIYQGIRLTPEQIAASARDEDVDVVGLSILSGSHLELIPETVRLLAEYGVDAPVVIGGIIPAADAERLREAGVAGVYTPKDFDVNRIMGEIVDLVASAARPGRRHRSRFGRRAALAPQEAGRSEGRCARDARAAGGPRRVARRRADRAARTATGPAPRLGARGAGPRPRRGASRRRRADPCPPLLDAAARRRPGGAGAERAGRRVERGPRPARRAGPEGRDHRDRGERLRAPLLNPATFTLGASTQTPVADPAWVRTVAQRADAVAARPRPPAQGPVRLLVVTHYLDLGGAQLLLQEMLRHMLSGDDVECLVISRGDGPLRAELERWGARVHITGGEPPEGPRTSRGWRRWRCSRPSSP